MCPCYQNALLYTFPKKKYVFNYPLIEKRTLVYACTQRCWTDSCVCVCVCVCVTKQFIIQLIGSYINKKLKFNRMDNHVNFYCT